MIIERLIKPNTKTESEYDQELLTSLEKFSYDTVLGIKRATEGVKIVSTKRITNLDSPYSLTNKEYALFCDTSPGVITVSLPNGFEGATFKIINCGANNVTITSSGNIQGSASDYTLSTGSITLTYNANEHWWG